LTFGSALVVAPLIRPADRIHYSPGAPAISAGLPGLVVLPSAARPVNKSSARAVHRSTGNPPHTTLLSAPMLDHGARSNYSNAALPSGAGWPFGAN